MFFFCDFGLILCRVVFDSSVIGLNFDFLVLNLTKHSSYLIYNAALYFSPVIQRQYREKYGFDEVGCIVLAIGFMFNEWIGFAFFF